MRLGVYCRVSTDKLDQLNSLETQKIFFEEFAEKNNYTLIKIYADEGISGTQLKKRPAFLQMMRDAEKGMFDVVATKDVSRMARNVLDFLQSIRKLKAMGIPCMFVNTNLSTQDGEMMLTMLATVAQEESKNTSSRIKFSKRLNAEKGKVPNLVYGYDKIIGDYFNMSINEFEADVVRRIYSMYINDGYGASKIAKILNSEVIKTKRGCNWTQNGVCRILTNRLYTGIIANGKEEIEDFLTGKRTSRPEYEWKTVERPDLAVINVETFEKAQRILAENREKFLHGQRKDCKHLFSTLIKCSACGHYFRQTKRKIKNGIKINWVCCGRNMNGADFCQNNTVIDEAQLLNSIIKYITSLILDKQKVIKKVIADFNKYYEPIYKNRQSEKEINKEIANLKKKRQKYLDMYEMEIISIEDLKDKTSGINGEIKRLEERLKAVQYSITEGDKLRRSLSDAFKTIDDILNAAEITNELLKRVIDRIEVAENGQIDIYFRLLTQTKTDEQYQSNSYRT